MESFRNGSHGEKAFTLIELMMVTAMLGLIIPVMILLFSKVSQGMAADEMHGQLKKLNELTMLRLDTHIKANKHMFQNDASNVTFLSKVGLMGAPAVLAGSHLPLVQPVQPEPTPTSFSPNSLAAPLNFGNCLLFGAYDSPTTIAGKGYRAPLVVSGASVTYAGASGPATMIIDLYRFYYYYLTTSTHPLKGVQSHGLVEWRSVQYADFYQLKNITDPTLKVAVIKWMTSAANFPGGNPVTLAWDSGQTTPYDSVVPIFAFYQLNNATGTWTGIANPTILQADFTYLTQIPSGILSRGFNYGICGNNIPPTYAWPESPPVKVPMYGTASGNYPGGFEVGLKGSAGGMEVLTRCLLVAKGGALKVPWNDITMIHNARDVW